MIKIIAHANCYDGMTASWVAQRALEDKGPLEILYKSYGDPVPEFSAEDEVYIVDFSYPRDILEDIASTVKVLWVLDHHKTAQEALEGLDYCIFDMNRSGAGIAWDFFFPAQERPALVNYVEDRDLWRFTLEASREVHAWFSSHPMSRYSVGTCVKQLEDSFWDCVRTGERILDYTEQKVEELLKVSTQWKEVGGYKIPCANAPYHMGSDVGHRLLELYPEAPFAGYFLFTASGDEQWGLRGRDRKLCQACDGRGFEIEWAGHIQGATKKHPCEACSGTGTVPDDFDVSSVAKGYGGGGHKKAAGFLMNRSTRG